MFLPKPASFQLLLYKCEGLIGRRTDFDFLRPCGLKEFPVTDCEVRWTFIQRILSLILEDNHMSGLGNVREWYLAGEHLVKKSRRRYILRIGILSVIYLPDNAAEGIYVTTRFRYEFRNLQIRVNEQLGKRRCWMVLNHPRQGTETKGQSRICISAHVGPPEC